MNKFRYQTFEQAIAKRVLGECATKERVYLFAEELSYKNVSAIWFDIELFILHQKLQINFAIEGGYFDRRYSALFEAVKDYEKAKSLGDESITTFIAMNLGVAVSQMGMRSLDDFFVSEIEYLSGSYEAAKKEVAKLSRSLPLKKKKLAESILKWKAQELADKHWKKDKVKELMKKDIVSLIENELSDFADFMDIKYYFVNDRTIGKWIQEVAPAYAVLKRGRPPKAK